VRDLLLRAKHLFVAATFAYPMRAGPWGAGASKYR
jgi:hypothetical protein